MAGQERITKLTKRAVDACGPAEGRYTVWDAELKGFGLRVAATGIKSYIARYRTSGGRTGTLRQMTLGRHGVMTPDEARALALGTVAHGGDPALGRSEERAGLTLRVVAETFLA